MPRILIALFLALALLPVRAAEAEEPGAAIQSVIEGQLSAFQANDLDRAFSFASPMIQGKFGDPENFGRMVEMGYPMVWRPRSHQMGALVQTDFGPVQLVLFEDHLGRMHEAGYLMLELDGIWRINGVHVRVAPGVGT